jgi:hypothetical protein
MAISTLVAKAELSPAEKIVYGREFRIRAWIEEGAVALVNHAKTIDRETAAMVGFDTTVSLFRIREERIRKTLVGSVLSVVREALKDELDLVEHSELQYRMDEDEVDEGPVQGGHLEPKIPKEENPKEEIVSKQKESCFDLKEAEITAPITAPNQVQVEFPFKWNVFGEAAIHSTNEEVEEIKESKKKPKKTSRFK